MLLQICTGWNGKCLLDVQIKAWEQGAQKCEAEAGPWERNRNEKEEELSCFNLMLLIYIAHYNLECPA